MANILIASLGESPVVVTAMYDLLTKREKYTIDEVVVLYPKGGMVKPAYDLIEEALKDACKLTPLPLEFDDTNDERTSFLFLRKLYQQLSTRQEIGDTVYLSLAGGRKNMSALMAWVVPFFSCIKKLYHVLDKDRDKGNFLSVEDIILKFSDTKRKSVMHPNLDRLTLIPIPFDEGLHISDELRSRLLSTSDEELDSLRTSDPDLAETIVFGQNVAQDGKILEVLVTAHVEKQFRDLCRNDITHAQGFELCFERMRSVGILRNPERSHGVFTRKLQKGEYDSYSQRHRLRSLTFHFFKRGGATERPVFHTVPKDALNCSDAEVENVETVIVSELELEIEGEYRSLEDILKSLTFPLEPTTSADRLPSVRHRGRADTILLIPLGTSPMIATQLYTLLTNQGRTIKEVILIYPQRSEEILLGAELIKKALKEEASIPCSHLQIQGLEDIDSVEACYKFQRALEEKIDKIREEHPHWRIELALSGGRKGMAALTMFVAHRKNIPHVYHTLIKDEQLNKAIENETTAQALHGIKIDKKERNDRLFLRAYAKNDEELNTKFVLFKVPVLPAGKS